MNPPSNEDLAESLRQAIELLDITRHYLGGAANNHLLSAVAAVMKACESHDNAWLVGMDSPDAKRLVVKSIERSRNIQRAWNHRSNPRLSGDHGV